jgi:hypothetical protein
MGHRFLTDVGVAAANLDFLAKCPVTSEKVSCLSWENAVTVVTCFVLNIVKVKMVKGFSDVTGFANRLFLSQSCYNVVTSCYKCCYKCCYKNNKLKISGLQRL